MSKTVSPQKGFTLIELLVVISIIGVLSSVAMTSLSAVRTKARDARRKSDLEQIALAMEQYYAQYGTYKVAGTGWGGTSGTGWFNYENAADSYPKSIARGLEEAGFFSDAPRDPKATSDNGYPRYMLYLCDSGFYVYAILEAPSGNDALAFNGSCGKGGSVETTYHMNYAAGHR